MTMTDPIADLLTRIRNALKARSTDVLVPASGVKTAITEILKEEGYILGFTRTDETVQGELRIRLKYASTKAKEAVITNIKRVSKPGLRVYVGKDEVPSVLNGLGIAILSTSKGVMTDRKARELAVGGEVLCSIY